MAVLLVLCTCLLPADLCAETLYVIDKLLVGVHESETRESTIIKVIPSDTRLEVLEKDKEFSRVRTPDGTEGWVDMSYLTDEKPARLVVQELEEWKQSRKVELAAAWEEVENLRTLLHQKSTETPAPAAVPAAADQTGGAEPDDLQAENAALKETLGEAERQLAALAKGEPEGVLQSCAAADCRFPLTLGWIWGILGFCLAIGFAGGLWVFDYRLRRRHGGFRV